MNLNLDASEALKALEALKVKLKQTTSKEEQAAITSEIEALETRLWRDYWLA